MNTSEFNKNLKVIAGLIKKNHEIILACHMNPDGDALGSMLGLGIALLKMKKKVVMLCPDKVPQRYISLPFADRIRQSHPKPANLAISLDCASMAQLPGIEKVFRQSKCIVEIDHHRYRDQFGDVQLISEQTSSIGEIIFLLLNECEFNIDKRIAECLLTSAIVETSSFSRPEVSEKTFEICAKLVGTGVDFNRVSDRYYWQKSLSAMYLTGLAFSRIKTAYNKKIVWSFIFKKDFKHFNGRQEDVDPVADELLMVENAQISLFFREMDNNMMRVSLRSKGSINVGYLATTYGGGGHDNVSSCRIHKTKTGIERLIRQAALLLQQQKAFEAV